MLFLWINSRLEEEWNKFYRVINARKIITGIDFEIKCEWINPIERS